MTIYRPELKGLGGLSDLPLAVTHPNHMNSETADFLGEGGKITELGKRLGADHVVRAGTFSEAMLDALDKVSAQQQFASQINVAAFLDPDSVNVEDVTIAQAKANTSLNIARNVLNRLVQGWRDLINTR